MNLLLCDAELNSALNLKPEVKPFCLNLTARSTLKFARQIYFLKYSFTPFSLSNCERKFSSAVNKFLLTPFALDRAIRDVV